MTRTAVTIEELTAFITDKVESVHDYSSCADALWETAQATFEYVSDQLGCTGWQSGFAAMKFLGQVNHWEGPYGVIRAQDMLYPQYDIEGKLALWLEEWRPWATEQAKQLLVERAQEAVHPDVWTRWETLANAT